MNTRNIPIMQVELKNKIKTGKLISEIQKGSLRDRISEFDDASVPKHMADYILQSLKMGGISPRLKPTTSPFNFNLPDPLRDYLEYRCSTTFSNMTKYLIEMIQNDMDNLPITGKEIPLADLCEQNKELANKAIRYTIAQFDRLGCIETIVVNENTSNTVGFNEKEGRMVFAPYHDPYGDLYKAIQSMAKNNEAGAEFDAVICHPFMESFVREAIKDTPWLNAKVITMTTDVLLYNIIFLKKYRTEIFNLKKSDALMNKRPDDHGEYFYDASVLEEWLKKKEEKEKSATEVKYRASESIHADGKSTFSVEKYDPSNNAWQHVNMPSVSSLEEAKKIVEALKQKSVVKEVIHEL